MEPQQQPTSAQTPRRASMNGGAAAAAAAEASAAAPQSAAMRQKQGEELIDEDGLILTIKAAVFLRASLAKEVLFWLLNLLTLGLISLACRWYPSLLARLRYVVVSEVDPSATAVLVTSLDNVETLEPVLALDLADLTKGWQPAGQVLRSSSSSPRSAAPRMFIWRHERFWYSPSKREWTRRHFDLCRPYHAIHAMCAERLEETLSEVVSLDAAFSRALTYGDNQLDVNAKPFPHLVLAELLKPFFAFQAFSIVIWLEQQYYIYMYVVIALSVIAILQSAFQEYQNLKALERLAKADGVINKIRLSPGSGGGDGPMLDIEPVTTSSLQPGDIVHVATNMVLPCDVLLLSGSAVMSEAMLTGESAPVLKASLPLDTPRALFKPDSERDGKFVLYSGTKVLQAKCSATPPVPLDQLEAGSRSCWDFGAPSGSGNLTDMPVMAMVLRTGFATSRGQLIRAILYPKPSKFNFERQTFLFMRVLLLALSLGMALQVSIYIRNGVGPWKTFLDSLNLVTVAVPPALPLALSIGTSVALARLKSFGIFCSDATRISAAGRVNCLCFDKTGTLTTDGLTLKGVHWAQQCTTNDHHNGTTSSSRRQEGEEAAARPPPPPPPPSLGELVTDVSDIHSRALQEVVLAKREAGLASEEDRQLMLSYVMAACHSISVLDQTDEATALVLRMNSEIIPDPSLPEQRPPESVALLEETGLLPPSCQMEEYVIDADTEETILLKLEPQDHDHLGQDHHLLGSDGHPPHGSLGDAGLSTGPGAPLLDLPTTRPRGDGLSNEKVQHLVGDSLEIQLFQESGWFFCTRPSAPPDLSSLLASHGGLLSSQGGRHALFVDGAFDDFNIWRHPELASYVDTVMLPPKAVKGDRHASAIAILRRFDFDSDLRRMGALIRTLPNVEAGGPRSDEAGQHFLLVKGAPESIRELCLPGSLPLDLDEQLQRLTLAGYRVLACGTRSLEHLSESSMLKGSREELEAHLTFAGLLVMENSLKEETTGFLRQYTRAGFRQIMVTGDNPLTAIAVAKMAGGAFLCSWRRAMLVDVVTPPSAFDRSATGGGAARRLLLSDVLDAGLRWDLMDYLAQHLPPGTLLVEAPPDEEEQEGVGGSSKTAMALEAFPPTLAVKPPALAEVDFICTGRAFAMLSALHAPFRDEEDEDEEEEGGHEDGRSRRAGKGDEEEGGKRRAQQQQQGRGSRGKQWTPLEVVLLRCNVFARMSPQNKQELMRSLQDLEYVVCMTGDGANDSGALKAADIGISIASAKSVMAAPPKPPNEDGQQEAPEDDPENARIATEISTSEAAVIAAPSIAAPFATGLHHIGAVSIVVTEGRGTLATSFTMFKYMFLYGIVQFVGVLILYTSLLELAPMQYLYADLFVVLPFVTFMPTLEALPTLSRGKPECNLVSFPVMRSIFGHSLLIVGLQLYQQHMLVTEPWYRPPDPSAPGYDRQVSVEGSSKFIYSNFHYIGLAVALCQTYGLFRVPLYRNVVLTALVVVELAASVVLVLYDWSSFDRFFQLTGPELPHSYRLRLLALGLASLLAFVLYERFCVPHKSLDEDPVSLQAPRRVVVVAGGAQKRSKRRRGKSSSVQQADGDGDEDETVLLGASGGGSDEGWGEQDDDDDQAEEEQSPWLIRLWDSQPTVLPKLCYPTPLYYRGMQATYA